MSNQNKSLSFMQLIIGFRKNHPFFFGQNIKQFDNKNKIKSPQNKRNKMLKNLPEVT